MFPCVINIYIKISFPSQKKIQVEIYDEKKIRVNSFTAFLQDFDCGFLKC